MSHSDMTRGAPGNGHQGEGFDPLFARSLSLNSPLPRLRSVLFCPQPCVLESLRAMRRTSCRYLGLRDAGSHLHRSGVSKRRGCLLRSSCASPGSWNSERM